MANICIFCKSNIIEDINYESSILECKKCNSKIESKKNQIFVLKHPNSYKYHMWIILLTFPIWFFINGLFGYLLKKYFNINMPLFMLFILFLPFSISMFLLGLQNIYNFIKNGYMILKWNVITYDNNKIEIIVVFICSLIIMMSGIILMINIINSIIN